MEQTHSRECHYHAVLIGALDYEVVADGSAGLCNILNAASVSALYIITEGEERVGTEGNAVDGCKVSLDLLVGKRLGLYGEVLLPVAVSTYVILVAVDVSVYNVISVGSAESVLKGQGKHLFMLTKEPGIRLLTCKTGAVDSGLLTCTNADSLTVYRVANGV